MAIINWYMRSIHSENDAYTRDHIDKLAQDARGIELATNGPTDQDIVIRQEDSLFLPIHYGA